MKSSLVLFPQELLRVKALGYRNIFEELVKKDLAVFEERRLQDVLLCRAQAPSHSVQVEGFDTLWEQRLPELLDRRQLYMKVSLLPCPLLSLSHSKKPASEKLEKTVFFWCLLYHY